MVDTSASRSPIDYEYCSGDLMLEKSFFLLRYTTLNDIGPFSNQSQCEL